MKILERMLSKNSQNKISLGLFFVLAILPVAAAFSYAVLYSFGVVGIANEGFTFRFWKEVLSTGEFIQSFGYSAAISAVSMVISISLALYLTIIFHKDFKNKILSFIAYLPLSLPGVVAAFFGVQVLSKSGFFSRLSYKIGWTEDLSGFPDLINDQYAIGIIITFVSVVAPFFLLLFLNIYENEKVDELHKLANSLGADRRQSIWKVEIPILLHKSKKLISLYLIFLMGAYEIPLILGREAPQMLSVLIVRDLKQYDLTKISEGYVIAVIYSIVIGMITYFIFSRQKQVYA